MKLRPVQRRAVEAMREYHALFAPIGVGHGKTLIGAFAAAVVPCTRPLYLCPPSLVKATQRKLESYRAHFWELPPVEVVSYGALSTRKGAGLLDRVRPDLLILDEAHALKNPSAVRTRRVRRYIARSGCRVVAMSGTMMKRSIKDFAHLLGWALKGESPLPASGYEIARWARVLDDDSYNRPSAQDRAIVAKAMRGRDLSEVVYSHPAAVGTPDASVDASLALREVTVPVPESILAMLRQLRSEWRIGDRYFAEPAHVADAERQLSQGFYYKFRYPPSRDWLEARRGWSQALRRYIPRAPEGRDQPALVMDLCRAGKAPTDYIAEAWAAWEPHKSTPAPPTDVVWESSFLVDFARRWMERHDHGLVWCAHRAMQDRLGAVPVGEEPEEGAPRVVSMRSHGTGLDLQWWRDSLLLCPGTDPAMLEQLIGRTHRAGQAEDVLIEMMVHTDRLAEDLQRARKDAEKIGVDMRQPQRLSYGDWLPRRRER